jgi:hypothetical protein
MSLRKAINDKCKECLYDPLSGGGTWRQQIAACTSPGCPLYPVRPLPHGKAANRFVVDYMGQEDPKPEDDGNE